MARFAIAPMSGVIRVLTIVLLTIPVAFLALALVFGAPLAWPAAFVAALYLATWLAARPSSFETGGGRLTIHFPVWTRTLAGDSLASALVLDAAALRRELGFAARVGVGGLWGGFGWLWSTRRGWIEMYVSRTDEFVWIERRGALPLLLTPDRPQDFVAELRRGAP